ncbi:uncharacterized protein LOC129576103 [Sitodiplosis mosellana]|uniref:uncharacterized protein LOC129576103 n=1 Tax=Sitodiplosis mosellana TaxID=263140 RepID=UPI0024444334|nr:uncharacterized protein LOC129576103 [Sitodiplosis mosellana]
MDLKVDIEYREMAFNRRMLTFAVVNRAHIDIKEFLFDAFNYYENELTQILDTHPTVKVNTCFSATFEKIVAKNVSNGVENMEVDVNDDLMDVDEDNPENPVVKTEKQTLYLHTKSVVIDREADLYQIFEEYVIKTIMSKVDDAIMRGSGFTLSSLNELLVQVNRYDPLRGSSYIKTPKYLASKRAIVNVKNNDKYCFEWAVLSALYPANIHTDRLNHYEKHKNKLLFTGIDLPMKIRDISKFEYLNLTISINVYMFDEKAKKIQPVRITNEVKRNHIHLLLLTETTGANETKAHYCWIKNLSRLISSQVSNHHGRHYFCDRCLNFFHQLNKLEEHRANCNRQNVCGIEMPTKGDDIVKFTNIKNQVKAPFIIYADVEALLKKPTEPFCKQNDKKPVKTLAYQQHEVYSIGCYFKCSFDESQSFYKAKRGPDCIDWFVEELHQMSKSLATIFNNAVPLVMTLEDEEIFNKAEICHICEGCLANGKEPTVRDHCHFTGKFRGAAHQSCNLEYRQNRTIPVVFHNLTNYDSHFIIKKLATGFPGEVKVIPINKEKYISFIKTAADSSHDFKSMVKFKFIDSFRFMASSLDKLSSLIPSEKKTLLRNEFRDINEGQMELLERKGVFCYDYVDSWEKLEETELPPIEAFHSKLSGENVSDKDYNFAREVWSKFDVKTLGEYADLYLKVDVCLLAIVFENFRETCSEIYKLDPANYYTAPGLSFDAMLRYTKVELELLKDVDMLLFVERGIRGGISQCSKRYAEANNKYMDTYDKEKETSYIMYVDCNNLYGYSMMQHLPIKGFQWCEKEFTAEEISNIADDSDIGYILEVDLDYPESLHDLHNDYPFCAENKLVPNTTNVKKLLLTLTDKRNYLIHYRMLKLALKHGLILKKVHKVIQFEQTAWLKSYIELNTNMRAKANNDFEKELYKLMNNAIFGKCMENVRSRVDIRLRSKWDGRGGARELIAKPNFKRNTIFDENLVAIEMAQTSIVMNKPISIGMAILDISKVCMYEYYYDFLKPKYGSNIELAYTDTNSFIIHVKTEDFYLDMKENLERYDTSDYPIDNIFEIPRVNKKIPGLFKDELNSIIIIKFVGLRSKMYCVLTYDPEANAKMKKAKGVKKCVLKREIQFNDYVSCLQSGDSISKKQNTFRTKMHTVYTIEQEKVALSPNDDKRFILLGNIKTLAHGHYGIKV